ncbi:hypothetical protein O2W18_13805 [Modestobacter sp. VKM Ac-2983]|uniref:hypothetical protein n=1 Tax=Modestobacter sp. VKM Ac-2983 TaxID=3004137 RepID=UPI0022AB7255|nr:hypothetical protein [Modestobacter sp. VKM Ac-2983]MCZ2806185.1 hypothetical protein [Modestobacter sp. VKM Ac-2983]
MFVFAAAVPALMVVVLGYVVGYVVTEWASGLLDSAFGAPLDPGVPEVVGWLTGLVLLGVVVRVLVDRRRRLRRALRRARLQGQQVEVERLEGVLAARARRRQDRRHQK